MVIDMLRDAVNQQYLYKINEYDKIIEVSQNWNEFAQSNLAAPSCFYPELINKSLWDFIADKETAHLYQLAVEKVRKSKNIVNIPIRCDSPETKRFLEITIKPLPEDHIEFSSKIIRIESRDPVQLLDFYVDRSDEFVKICSYCKQIELSEDEWIEADRAIIELDLFGSYILPRLTHGVCPMCYESIMEKLI